jgi:hypothetical protein
MAWLPKYARPMLIILGGGPADHSHDSTRNDGFERKANTITNRRLVDWRKMVGQ